MSNLSTTYYRQAIDLSDAAQVEAELRELLEAPIHSVADLEDWIQAELKLGERISEVMVGHMVDFYRDTANEEKRDLHMHDQAEIQPLLLKYQAAFDKRFCENEFVSQLDEKKYGLMRRVRSTNLELFREENLPLQVREQEIFSKYNELMGGLMVDWEEGQQPLPYVQAQLDNPNRMVRERAWKAIRLAYDDVKAEVDTMMTELVQLRHQIARNAGFETYRDYVFREKNREYSVEDCRRFHAAVEKYVVPVWDEIAEDLRQTLGAETYRPWDASSCTISAPPFTEVDELVTGVRRILGQIDGEFGNIFDEMRNQGLLDLEGRQGKAPGGFCVPLMVSRSSFVFANFSPSYFALIALIHEMGHAINGKFQLQKPSEWEHHRSEIAELYSHGMELLALDKMDVFYDNPQENRAAVRERLRRSLNMLMGPLAGDVFQHWIYEHPNHTAEERDAAYGDIAKRYSSHPIDWSGYEKSLGQGWIGTIHFLGYPFYNIEYSMAELGALQLLQQYRENPSAAIENYKRGAKADYNQSIADVYAETGVKFDFSDEAIEETAEFLRQLWRSI